MQVIAGNAELLSSQPLEPAVQRRIAAITAETARATSLIGTLQAYARAERDPLPIIDLWTVVDRAASLRAAALRRLRITMTVASGGRAPASVAGPGARLLQIVLDLLLEAERVLHGTTAPTIIVNVEAAGECFAVRVRAAASDLAVDTTGDTKAEDLLTVAAQLWTAGYLAERAGGSVGVMCADGHRDWTFTVPAAVPAKA